MKKHTLIAILFSCAALCAQNVAESPGTSAEPKAGDAPAAIEQVSVSLIPQITKNPPPMYSPRMRVWQGIPSIEISNGGRLWVTWYSGNVSEGAGRHFTILATSGDDGETWEESAVFDPSGVLGATSLDPNIWKDKNGQVNWILNFSISDSRARQRTVWYVPALDAENPRTKWGKPRLMANGVELNKPTRLKDGRLIIPADKFNKVADRTRFYISKDGGKTSEFLSSWSDERVVFSEHMIVEKLDGTLWCLARGKESILQARSKDGGKTWETMEDFPLKVSVNTRFYFARLKSGALLLVANDDPKQRSNMTAFLSDDDGATWPYKFAIDERGAVSYPDATQSADGFIYIAYDRGRYLKDQQEILFAKITEDDIRAGKLVNEKSKLACLVSKLAPHGGGVHKDWETSEINRQYKERLEAKKEAKEK